jgi:L-lactate dehydrogenase complex protein LldG
VVIKESSTPSRLAALAPWIHITLVDGDTCSYRTLVEAISDLGTEPYVVFATGPSKTADVEGILIEGVHGPGRQICCRAGS